MAAVLTDPAARRDAGTISLVGFAHGTSHFFQLVIPSLFPWLMPGFSLSFTEVGALMTVFFLISGIGQALAGFAVDRYGAHRVLLFGVGTLALSGMALGLAQNYPMLMLAAAVAGLGNCVFHPADFTLLNRRVAKPRLGLAFSVHGLSGNLGWAAAPVTMAMVAANAGWRAAAFVAGGVGAAVLLALLWQNQVLHLPKPGAVDAAADKTARPGSAVRFLAIPAVWLCFGFFFLTTMAFGVLQNFAPATLQNLYGLSLAAATSSLSAYLVASACGMLLGGFLAGREGPRDRVIVMALTLAAVMAIILASGVLPGWSVAGLMAAMGFGVGMAGPSRDLLVREAATGTLGPAAFGRVYGFVYSGLDAGFACAPLIFGPLMDLGQFQLVIAGMAVLQITAIATALTVGSHTRPAPAALSGQKRARVP